MTAQDWIALSNIWAPVLLALITLGGTLATVLLQHKNAKRLGRMEDGLKTALIEKTEQAGYAKGKLEGEHAGLETGLSHIKIDDIDKLKK